MFQIIQCTVTFKILTLSSVSSLFSDISEHILISIYWKLSTNCSSPPPFFFFDMLERYASYIISSSGCKLCDKVCHWTTYILLIKELFCKTWSPSSERCKLIGKQKGKYKKGLETNKIKCWNYCQTGSKVLWDVRHSKEAHLRWRGGSKS